jgi:hypothetical protein
MYTLTTPIHLSYSDLDDPAALSETMNTNTNTETGSAGGEPGESYNSHNSQVIQIEPGDTEEKPPRPRSPFDNKGRFKGPQRRVIEIIEFARKSVGGPPNRQLRKISNVERRLMDSPLAQKLWIDKPILSHMDYMN